MSNHGDKARKRAFLPGVLVSGVGVLMLVVVSTLMKRWLIIRYGIRTFVAVRNGTVWLIIGGVVLAVVLSIPDFLLSFRRRQESARHAERQRQETQILTDYYRDSENPEKVRKRLAQLEVEIEGLDWLTQRCRSQMDAMDSLQARQKLLIDSNAAIYLQDTVDVVNNIEREICLSYREIINLCIAAGDADQLDAVLVEEILRENKSRLEDVQKLLDLSAKWINDYNTNHQRSSRDELDSWMVVINDTLKKGRVNQG